MPAAEHPAGAGTADPAITLTTLAHIQHVGDVRKPAPDRVGKPGSARWIEGFAIAVTGGTLPGLAYCGIRQDGSLTDWVEDGGYCGTRGKRAPLIGFCIRSGESGQDVSYAASFVDGSTAGPMPAGELCRAASGAALESIQVSVTARAAARPAPLAPRTLLFCTSYVGPGLGARDTWAVRYSIWRQALKQSGLRHDQVLIIDDASQSRPDWTDVDFIAEGARLTSAAPTAMYRFDKRMGRRGVSDFPGWVRSFFFAARYAEANGFEKLVHLESDAFVISEKMQDYINNLTDGWTAPYCNRYRRPESAIQIIAGSGLSLYRAFASRDIESLAGKVIEKELPLTHVESGFRGDRFREFIDHVPHDADWSAQTAPRPGTPDDEFYWWLQPAGETAKAIAAAAPVPAPAAPAPAPAPVAAPAAGPEPAPATDREIAGASPPAIEEQFSAVQQTGSSVTGLTLVEQEPRIGQSLHELARERQFTDYFPLDDAADLGRSTPFVPQPPEPGIGPFGQYMVNPAFRRYRADAVAAYQFDNVHVIGTDGVVLLNGGVLRNTLAYLNHWLPDSNVESFRRSEFLRLRQAMPVVSFTGEGRYLIGFTGAWRNHSHWVAQCLPKLFAFTMLRRRFRDLKVVLPPLETGSPQQRTLDLLGIGADAVATLPPNAVTGFSSALVLPDLDIWSVAPFTAQAAEQLVSRLPKPEADAPPLPERLYLHRAAKGREVTNFAAVQALVERYGFTVTTWESSDFAVQAAAMQAAKFVIGEHDPLLSNILFCREGTRALELFNPFSVQPAFWSLASIRGVEYGYVTGSHSPAKDRPEPNWNTAYELPLDKLEAAIRALLQDNSVQAARPAPPARAAVPPAAAPVQAPPPVQAAPPPAPVTALAEAPEAAAQAEPVLAGAAINGLAEPIFDLTADLGSFGRSVQNQRILLFAAALPPAQLPIHRQGSVKPEFVAEHMHYPPPTGVHAYAAGNATVWGNGLISSGNQFVAPWDCIPGYFRANLRAGGQPLPAIQSGALKLENPETLALDYPVACALHPNIVYGHFLLEMLPRLYVLSVLRQLGADFPLLLSSRVAPWVKDFVKLLHPDERIVWYDAAKQRVTAPSVILPSMMHTDHNFHPAINLMVSDLIKAAGQGAAGLGDTAGPERIFLSRAKFGEDRIENETEVEQVMTDFGFAVVRPHELSPVAQIRLFAGAKIVAGEFGSALHNTIFSPPGTQVIAVNFFNHYQSAIARVRRQRIAFVPPEDGTFRHWRLTANLPRKFRADLAILRRTTQEMLANLG